MENFALFWNITQLVVVNFYDVSGQLIGSIFEGHEIHSGVRNIPQYLSSQLLRGGSVKSGNCVVISVVLFYRYEPHNDVSFNDGPRIRR
jgi:hypothetical protein